MDYQIETPRLLLRPFIIEDAHAMFELDSDPRVVRYVGNKPVKSLDETRKIMKHVFAQYERNGIGRMTVVLKDTNEIMGWSGLKLEDNNTYNGQINFYDLGYRFMPRFWRKGYGFESAQASLDWGFNVLKLKKISGFVQQGNIGSRRILEKVGLIYTNTFPCWGDQFDWLELENQNPPD